MTTEPDLAEGRALWLNSKKFSADEISARANLQRLYAQRTAFRRGNWQALSTNYEKSVFYQLDLEDAAHGFVKLGLETPRALPDDAAQMLQMHNRMLRAVLWSWKASKTAVKKKRRHSVCYVMVCWGRFANKRAILYSMFIPIRLYGGRSPVRVDVAGGWTDTPPYSLYSGGNVVNLSIELNGQPPLQVYVKTCKEPHIVLRSIDMGAMEVVNTYEELQDYRKVGSPFSIPKAALALAGFIPQFSEICYGSLQEQLEDFGAGIEVTLLGCHTGRFRTGNQLHSCFHRVGGS